MGIGEVDYGCQWETMSAGKIKGEWGGVRASPKKGTYLIVRGIVRSVFKDN
jgi:hypothetical protein